MTRAPLAALCAALLLAVGCRSFGSPRWLTVDPVVVVHGGAQDELGVSTDYGVVFLGRSVQSGRVEFTAWFGDGPSREEGVVEPVGGGLYATEAEIELPTVPLTFVEPAPGARVIVRGRRGGSPWEVEARVAVDPRVEGLILVPAGRLRVLQGEEVGAGIFLQDLKNPPRLVGLVSGRLQLTGAEGTSDYVTAVGPRDLWRLVVHRRNSDRPRRPVYREDIR